MDEPAWLEPDQERAWRALQLMQMRLTGRLARDLAEHDGLSDGDYAVLVALTDEPTGYKRVLELAEHIGWEKSRASHQIARMERRGLVAKQVCPSDRRGAYVVVTEEGRAAIERAAPGHVAAVRRFFIERLTPEQLNVVGAAAEAVLAGLAGSSSDSP